MEDLLGPKSKEGPPDRKGKPTKITTKDHIYMDQFIKLNDLNKLPNDDLISMLPDKTPLIHSLLADIHFNIHGYKYPECMHVEQMAGNASININTPTDDIREIDIVNASEEEQIEFVCWAEKQFKNNQSSFPSGYLSVDTESVMIRVLDYERIYEESKKIRQGRQGLKVIRTSKNDFHKGEKRGIIARIIIGDGINWNATIRFPWNPAADQITTTEFQIGTIAQDNPIIRFLESVTAWVGSGIIKDRDDLVVQLNDHYGISPRFPRALEIESMMAALGSAYPRSNMFVNHLLVTGTLLNKSVSCCDNRWHYNLDMLNEHSPAMIQYLIGDIKSSYICATVVAGLLIRDLFPDPDAICTALDLDQPSWVRYFCSLLASVYGETKLTDDLSARGGDRKHIMQSVRGFTHTPDGKRIQATHSREVELFSSLIGPWPTVPYGGARNLHVVRLHLLEQYQTLRELDHRHPRVSAVLDKKKPESDKEMEEMTKKELTEYNRKKEDWDTFVKDITYERSFLGSYYWEQDITAVQGPGLLPDPQFIDTLFMVDPSNLGYTGFSNQAKEHKRQIGPAIQEYCRLNVKAINYINRALDRVNIETDQEIYKYWKKTRIYERIRLIYQNIECTPPFQVDWLDTLVRTRIKNSLEYISVSMPTEGHQDRYATLQALKVRAQSVNAPRVKLQNQAIAANPAPTKNDRRRAVKRDYREFRRETAQNNEEFRREVTQNSKEFKAPSKKKFKAGKRVMDLRHKLNQKRDLQPISEDPEEEPLPASHPSRHPSLQFHHVGVGGVKMTIKNTAARSRTGTGAKNSTGLINRYSSTSQATEPQSDASLQAAREPYLAYQRSVAYSAYTLPDYQPAPEWYNPPPQQVDHFDMPARKKRKKKSKGRSAQTSGRIDPIDFTDEPLEDEYALPEDDFGDYHMDHPNVQAGLQAAGQRPPKIDRRYKRD